MSTRKKRQRRAERSGTQNGTTPQTGEVAQIRSQLPDWIKKNIAKFSLWSIGMVVTILAGIVLTSHVVGVLPKPKVSLEVVPLNAQVIPGFAASNAVGCKIFALELTTDEFLVDLRVTMEFSNPVEAYAAGCIVTTSAALHLLLPACRARAQYRSQPRSFEVAGCRPLPA